MYFFLLTWRNFHLKHLKYISHNAQNRRSVELLSRIFETNKNSGRPHECHIYNSDEDIAMKKMCLCNSQYHGLPHWKYLLQFCEKFPGISIPNQETNTDKTNTCLTIRFHVYHNVSHCTVHGIRPYEERTIYSMCCTDIIYIKTRKVYTRTELVLIENLI